LEETGVPVENNREWNVQMNGRTNEEMQTDMTLPHMDVQSYLFNNLIQQLIEDRLCIILI